MLTEIDVQATLRDKLGADIEPYLIPRCLQPFPGASGAQCRPQDRAAAPPCTVVIRTEASRTSIEALDPQTMVAVAGEPSLQPVTGEAATRLGAASDTLREADRAVPPSGARRHRHAARGPKTLSGMTIAPASDTP